VASKRREHADPQVLTITPWLDPEHPLWLAALRDPGLPVARAGNHSRSRTRGPASEAGGTLLVDNADLDLAWIETTLIPVLTDPERIAAMSARAPAAGAPDADVVLAQHELTALAERRRSAS
jgi:UDP-N-acetylglucosamine--N-acetylmuramyl-(pentapeptide) pyrophosphoryl-undecaprenol N-acetylglucosamine transferase